MLTFPEFRRTIAPMHLMNRVDARAHYKVYIMEHKMNAPALKTSMDCYMKPVYSYPPCVSLGDCEPAYTPTINWDYKNFPDGPSENRKQKGNNPMRCETTSTAAVATIINAESETKTQRDFLMGQFRETTRYEWADAKITDLRKLFNLDAPKYPKTSQELLDAFTKGKFAVDQAKVDRNSKHYSETEDDEDDCYDGQGERFYGITFTDLPTADPKGYETALTAYRTLKKDTERSIMIGTPAEGLVALKAFELWMPTATAAA